MLFRSLGARLACAPRTTPHLKMLVLDDVLVGLDHSNRLPVLSVLQDYFADWQVVLLTHDRGWFDLARQHLPNGWTCYEVYEGDQAALAPMPIVRKTQKRPAPALLQKSLDGSGFARFLPWRRRWIFLCQSRQRRQREQQCCQTNNQSQTENLLIIWANCLTPAASARGP